MDESGADLIYLRISDTGIGILADKQEDIFDPFVQVRSLTSSTEGTGLGLAVSRNLARGMGWGYPCAKHAGGGKHLHRDVADPVTRPTPSFRQPPSGGNRVRLQTGRPAHPRGHGSAPRQTRAILRRSCPPPPFTFPPPMNADVIVRHIGTGFLAVDADWVVRVTNPRASTLLRRRSDEIEGKALWDAIPGLRDTSAAYELKSAESGTVERRSEFFSPSLYNWFEIWCVPDGPDVRYVFFQDVTDRARAMQSDAVRESLRHILMDAPVAITITRGAEHRFEMLNAGARALLGGRNLEGLVARSALPEVDSMLFDVLDRVYTTGERVSLQDVVVTYDRLGDGQMYTGTFDILYLPLRSAAGQIEGTIQTAVETTSYAAARRATR